MKGTITGIGDNNDEEKGNLEKNEILENIAKKNTVCFLCSISRDK